MDQAQTWETRSVEETVALGRALGRGLAGGETIGLVGLLGAGKTQLAKGIALGNGLADERTVTSPTFTLVHDYPGRLRLLHVDAYRLRDSRELVALGPEEWVNPASAVVIEWADRVRGALPDDVLWVTFEVTGDTLRAISFVPLGRTAVECLERLRGIYR